MGNGEGMKRKTIFCFLVFTILFSLAVVTVCVGYFFSSLYQSSGSIIFGGLFFVFLSALVKSCHLLYLLVTKKGDPETEKYIVYHVSKFVGKWDKKQWIGFLVVIGALLFLPLMEVVSVILNP